MCLFCNCKKSNQNEIEKLRKHIDGEMERMGVLLRDAHTRIGEECRAADVQALKSDMMRRKEGEQRGDRLDIKNCREIKQLREWIENKVEDMENETRRLWHLKLDKPRKRGRPRKGNDEER